MSDFAKTVALMTELGLSENHEMIKRLGEFMRFNDTFFLVIEDLTKA